jgi:hypothetical protein
VWWVTLEGRTPKFNPVVDASVSTRRISRVTARAGAAAKKRPPAAIPRTADRFHE